MHVNEREREKKERSSSLYRWILIKYWWSAVLKAWLGPDWAKPLTSAHMHMHKHKLHTQVEQQRCCRIWAGFHYASCCSTCHLPPLIFHSHLSASAFHFLLPHRYPTQEITQALQSQMHTHPTVVWHAIKQFLDSKVVDKMSVVHLLKGLLHPNDKNTYFLTYHLYCYTAVEFPFYVPEFIEIHLQTQFLDKP